jgi:DDE superfamily endonuclease/Helix-turn-helix of DDE superfamily endonuclease
MNIAHLERNPRLMHAMTGMSWQEYIDLVPVFEKALITIKLENKKRKRGLGGGQKGHLKTTAAKLFFVLVYYKTYPTFDVMGFWFGKSRGRSCEAAHFFSVVLERALGYAMVLPERKIHSVDEFTELFPGVTDLFLDGSERRMERPQKNKRNVRMYSGKKKTHTRKMVVGVDDKKRIRIMSPAKPGRRHDKRISDSRLIVERTPKHVHIWADSGFAGIQHLHHNTHVVERGTKKKPLTTLQVESNRTISSFRMVVENALSGMKRFYIMQIVLRNKIGRFDDRMQRICGGLWNWHLNYVPV